MSQDIPFKADGHFTTDRYARLVSQYLSLGMTNKTVHRLLGLNVHLVKALDKGRLEALYEKAPSTTSRYNTIDEISIHSYHQYDMVVIDLETGHVLFCEAGKRKQQVQHFIQYVGKQWLSKVAAVSMDMNAQYDSAFKEAAPRIQIVYDLFENYKRKGLQIPAVKRRQRTGKLFHLDRLMGINKDLISTYVLLNNSN